MAKHNKTPLTAAPEFVLSSTNHNERYPRQNIAERGRQRSQATAAETPEKPAKPPLAKAMGAEFAWRV